MPKRLALSTVLLVLVLAACAAGPNPEVGAAVSGSPAGFFHGVWHGLISPITFLISLFSDGVSVYEVRNSGNWYDFGFVLGAGILFGGGPFGARRRRRR
jgi:hypothetical protein